MNALRLVNVHAPMLYVALYCACFAYIRYAEDPTHCNLHEDVAHLDRANRAWLTHAVIASIHFIIQREEYQLPDRYV